MKLQQKARKMILRETLYVNFDIYILCNDTFSVQRVCALYTESRRMVNKVFLAFKNVLFVVRGEWNNDAI